MNALPALRQDISACRLCAGKLPEPRPILSADARARILLAGQAPGRKVHETGIPWNDASGDRLRAWLGLSREQFYDARNIAIVPMGFCFPGTGNSGDLPPRPECAAAWHPRLLPLLPDIKLTLAIGQYAQAYHLGSRRGANLTETVANWREYAPAVIPLPHPSPRNQLWLKRNPWFEAELLPELRALIAALLNAPA